MKKLKFGLTQALSSALIGLILTAVIGYFAAREWIPSYSPLLLAIFNLFANIFTMTKMRRWGIFYTFGWLAGAFVFNALGLLGTVDVLFNIVIPIMIFLLRLALFVRGSTRKVFSK